MRRWWNKAWRALYLLANSGFPWASIDARRQAGAGCLLRLAARQAILARWPLALRPVAFVGMAFGWPFGSLRDAIQSSANLGPHLPKGRSRMGLVWWSWRVALKHNVPPVEALAFRLHELPAADPAQWIYSSESSQLLAALAGNTSQRFASDKRGFAIWCEERNIPCIPTLAVAAQGRWTEGFDGQLPFQDLLVKPQYGSNGAGVESWHRDGERFRSPTTGSRLLPEELGARILSLASDGEVILQPLLKPHSLLAGIAGTGMPAMRIITLRWPDATVEIGPAMLQAPLPGATISQSGPFRLVDTSTGQIQEATNRLTQPVFAWDPGSQFPQANLPDWPVVLSALRKAHTEFPGHAPVIGWDVLFTDAGPLLCEANISLSFFYFQYASPQALAHTSIGKVIEAWL